MVLVFNADVREPEIEFSIYTHYLGALGLVVLSTHSTLSGMAKSMMESKAVRNLQRRKLDAKSVESVTHGLRHAWFTELQTLIPDSFKQVLPYSNHWLPVQVYYSIYLAIRAYADARGMELGPTHESALRAVQSEIASQPRLYASPWNVVAVGNPSQRIPTLKNCDEDDLQYVNPITSPRKSNAWALVAQFLRTTRKRKLESRITGWRIEERSRRTKDARSTPSSAATRRAKARPNLSANQRSNLVAALRPTTLFDALYRLRIRSNYEDADAYMFGGGNAASAREYYDAFSRVRNAAMLNFELLTARLIGIDVFLQAAEAFLEGERRELSESALVRRVKALSAAM